MKQCRECLKQKSRKRFYGDKRTLDKLMSYCKSCIKKRGKLFRKLNPEKQKDYDSKRDKNKRTSQKLVQRYGITIEKYDEILSQQNYRCDICKTPQENFSVNLAVDHCHKTSKVRGLLCANCNMAVGALKENEQVIITLLEYIRKHKNAP